MNESFLRELGFNNSTLKLIDNPILVDQEYKVFKLRTGKKLRIIQEPKLELKQLQKELVKFFNQFPFHSSCIALKNHSVLDNASPHHNSQLICKVDLKNFFPNTDIYRIFWKVQHFKPEWEDLMVSILPICSIGQGTTRVLPTGAPTSPILANIAATMIDHKLNSLAQRYNAKYTRYVDDITFSFSENLLPNARTKFLKIVKQLIEEDGYQINQKKTKWIQPNHGKPFHVTGVALKTPDANSLVPRNVRRLCRGRLNSLARTANNSQIDSITAGYLAYIKMLDNESYNKLMIYYHERLAFYEHFR